MISAFEALARLREGNDRFAVDTTAGDSSKRRLSRPQPITEQEPFAVVIGCSDSRVPPEIIFNSGPGDLFVIRVAGNIVGPSQLGSAELAAEMFGTPLVVVLGHSTCGAVRATIDELQHPSEGLSPNLRSIVDRIRPSVEPLLKSEPQPTTEALIAIAVRQNIRASVEQLRLGSAVLERLIRGEKVHVVGAEYSLATGIVDFFEHPFVTD